MQPNYNPIALLVYSAKSGLVSDLMVDGQWIMRNYKIISIKEEEVIGKISEKILFILGISK